MIRKRYLKVRSGRIDIVLKNMAVKLPDVFLSLLVSFSITYALASGMYLTFLPGLMLLIVMSVMLALFIAFLNRTASIVSAVLLGMALVSSLVYALYAVDFNKLVEFLDGYFYWLIDFIKYPDVPDPTYQLITVIALCIFVSVLSYIFVIRKFSFPVILAGGVTIFVVQVAYRVTGNIVPFYLFLAAALMSYLKHVYLVKSKMEVNEYAKHPDMLVWSIPLSVVLILLASSIQASNKPIQWKWLDQKIYSAYVQLKEIFDYESFDYFSLSASSGFGDSGGDLGGRVRLDRTNVLYITTTRRIYLKGATKDLYTGNRWINSVTELAPTEGYFSSLYSDAEEMLEGMKILTGSDELPGRLLYKNPITVTFLNLKTKSLFIPSKIIDLGPLSGDINTFISDTGDLSSEKKLSKNFLYNMTSYVPATGSEQFQDALRKSRNGLYGEYLEKLDLLIHPPQISPYVVESDSTAKVVPDLADYLERRMDIMEHRNDDLTSEESIILEADRSELIRTREKVLRFKEHSDAVYEKYLQLPENLPQRIKDLAASLVVSADNDFDKARAIEKYIAESFVYNLDVRSTPRNRDFVDYFLFDLQEGYCSYFASAMTVLARCVGLPARYVEGYMLPPSPVKDRFDAYVVTNMQAHAWTEIYFEGFGWLPFEPTPPFRSAFYSVGIQEHVQVSPSYNPAYNDYMEMMRRYYTQFGSGGFTGPVAPGGQGSRLMLGVIALWAALAAAALFVLLLIFNAVRANCGFRLSAMPPRSSVIKHYSIISC